ncbi:hypothetical protein GCM10022280_17320 [Sphingomonas swuensis]|uniref:Uncharacterized protein n=1 Tax=Sphingomonas swuensis TaxID=977800 RepID=A0ABP7SYR4_9SPHN
MPYRHAHWYILSLFPLAAVAFWPTYLGQFGTAPWELHAHGLTATAWLLLLALQSWTIHHGQRATHRTVGPAVLALFPLFMAGGAGIFFGMADRYAAGAPFQAMWAPELAWFDFVGVAMVAYFVFMGLKHRRSVRLHSGYLLATAIALLPPIIGRLSGIPLGIRGPEDFDRLHVGFQATNVLVAAIAFLIAFRQRKDGRPFVLAGAATILSSILFEVPGHTPGWERIYASLAPLPSEPFILLAGIAGVGIAAAGWFAGKRPSLGGALPA